MTVATPGPRRVLFLADDLDGIHGGTEGQLHLLIRNLPAGWEAGLWVLREANDLAGEAFGLPIRALGLGSLKSPRTLWRLRRLAADVRAGRFDVIHGVLADTCFVAPLLGRLADVPAITSRRDLGYWQTPRLIDFLRRVDRQADAIIANAEAIARRTVEVEHALPSQVRTIHNGHPREGFDVPADPALRAKLGIPPEAPVIGLLANFRPLKRVEDLIDAVALLGAQAADVHVLLIGTGPGGDEHLRRAAACGLAGRVHVHGVLGDVVPVLRHLSIGVLCSSSEGLSNAIIENMACGLPVVASDVGGNPELVVDGETGLLYPCGDVEALAHGLGDLIADPARARCLGRAGRARFEARFTIARMVKETVGCYEDVLAAGLRPPCPDLRWRVVTNVDDLEALAPAWEALLGDGQFFVGPVWTLTWMRATGARPCVPVAEDEAGRLVGLLPLAWGAGRALVTCGQGLGADHVDVVAAPGRADDVARGAFDALDGVGWRRIVLAHVAEDAALRRVTREAAFKRPFGERYVTTCPYTRPEGDWPTFLARQMRPRTRKHMRYRARRFFEREGARIRRVTDVAEVGEALTEIFALHARRFEARGEASSFSGTQVRALHQGLTRRLAEQGRLGLVFLEAEGRTRAALYTFTQGRRLYYFQTALDPEDAQGSPGRVLLAALIEEDVIGAGLEECDFLDGDEAYKLSWATGTRRLFDVSVFPATRRGRLGAFVRGALALAKEAVRRGLALRRRRREA